MRCFCFEMDAICTDFARKTTGWATNCSVSGGFSSTQVQQYESAVKQAETCGGGGWGCWWLASLLLGATWKPSKWALQKKRSLPSTNSKGQAVSCCRRVNLSIQWWLSTFHDFWIFEGTVLGIYNEGTSMRCIVLHVSRLCCGLKHLWDGQAVWLSLRLQPWAIPVCIYRYTEQNMVIAMGV